VNWVLLLACVGLVLGFRSSSNLAAAYGIAVTLTMVITTLLAFFVARAHFGWTPAFAGAATLFFLLPDTAFAVANMVKVADGGWFPLAVAVGIFILMTTWHRGRIILGERFRERIVPLSDFFELIHVERPARVPGTAVYMTSNLDGTPPPLLQNLLLNRTVQQRVVLLTVIVRGVPYIAEAGRAKLDTLEEGFLRIVAEYGFMETPDVPELLERLVPDHMPDYTTYFLGRETLIASERPGMALWREKLFAFMSRNAQPATTFFQIPPDRVMEIGTQIEI
jgi:KUP system potassium uptake protein